MAYNLQINEAQRQILVRSLETSNPNIWDGIKNSYYHETIEEEANMLLAMLRDDVPKAEKEHPRILHGLCL